MEDLKSVLLENHTAGKSLIPWLIFPISPTERRSDTYYVLEKNTRYGMLNFTNPDMVHILDLPDHILPGTCCVSVSGTWMLMCYDSTTIFLLNPFTGKKVDLPSEKICIPKVSQFVVSENMIVMAIYGDRKRLAYCKPDDQTWTWVNYGYDPYVDLMYFDEQFIALDERNGVVVLNYDGFEMKTMRLRYPTGKEMDEWDRRRNDYKKKSLVCWSEKLLMVDWKLMNENKNDISDIWEFDTVSGEWVAVKDLGDYTLFVGNNYSCALPCSSEGHWKKNCVYYADNCKKEDVVFHEIKMKDLCDKTSRHLCYARGVVDIGTQFLAGCGAWIVPSLSQE